MKLLINKPLTAKFDSDATDDVRELLSQMRNDYCIFSALDEENHTVTIHVQKCTLDQISMNHVFSDLLCYFDYSMQYAALGGKGCDFSIVIVDVDQRKLK